MAPSRKVPVLRILIATSVLISLTLFLRRNRYEVGQEVPVRLSDDSVLFPKEYHESSTQTPYCQSHFGNLFLENLSKSGAEYCTTASIGQLTCFSSSTVPDHSRIDVFCVGGPATFEPQTEKFVLDCKQRELANDEFDRGARPISQFPTYWYSTGPKNILKDYIELREPTTAIQPVTKAEQFYILVKRDAVRDNMWHSLMEIMGYYMSIDVLMMTTNPLTSRPYFQAHDIINTQVVILDDLPDGHFFDLWTLFAKKPPIRLSRTATSVRSLPNGNIIMPLPGGANQFWQGDWEFLECTDSSLLRAFSKRVLNFYKIVEPPTPPDHPVVVTFVNRTTTRKLIDQDTSLALLQKKYRNVRVDVVDYSSLSFADQLAITRKTDVLVGAHGAGLTHGMFLRHDSALVEIMPVGFHHKGFRNMASMLGHRYFMQHSDDNKDKTGAMGDWQIDDVFIEPAEFVALVGKAIESNRKLLRG